MIRLCRPLDGSRLMLACGIPACWLVGLLLMLITICPSPTHGAAPTTKTSDVLANDPLSAFTLIGNKASLGKLERVAVEGQPFKDALRVTTTRDPGVEWDLQIAAPTATDVKKDDVLFARFWVRCVDSMTGEGYAGFVFEQNAAPNAKSVELRVGAPANWTECCVPCRASQDLPAGKAQLCFRAGYDRQTIEIGGLELVNYGPGVEIEQLPHTRMTYAGRAADAPWRREALARIEQIRKGDLAVKVLDAAGKPVPNAQVHVQLKRHAFGFGSCVTVEQITGTSADDARAREIIEKYFNRVVFENDMKWPAMWDGVPPKLDQSVDWLLKRGIEVRGHNLQWPSWQWSPTQLRAFENDPAELRRRCAERVTSAVTHFKGKLVEWDVVNEPYNNVDLQNILGRDVLIDWFKLAKQADPACQVYVNDFGIFDGGPGSAHRQHYFETIKFLKDGGAPLDGIGIQSHFGAVMPPPTQLLSVLDQFAQFGLPIESTEFSLNTDDPELQADYVRDYMIAVFSHPQVKGIMLWGFWEGRHWRPRAALWSRDWTIRPHGQVWLDLVTRQWNTDVTLTTDAAGTATVRGFLGRYEITATAGGKTASATPTLAKDGVSLNLTLD